ncbi:MAG: hypothetical protein ACI4N3_04325 [Alphaproteobacteria bacterium]
MKISFDNFSNKYSLLKKTLLGLFTVSSAAGAQTIYQCTACPNGLSSNPGAVGSSQCFNPCSKGSSSTIFSGSSNWSGTLQPGWYRISLRGEKGASTSSDGGMKRVCKTLGGCEVCAGGCVATCTGGCRIAGGCCNCDTGGDGAKANYTFYVGVASSASYTYNNGSPKFTVTESGTTRTYTASRGSSATYSNNPEDVTFKNQYGSVTGKAGNVTCYSGARGSTTYSPSTLFVVTDKNKLCSTSYTADGLSSAGAKLVKL